MCVNSSSGLTDLLHSLNTTYATASARIIGGMQGISPALPIVVPGTRTAAFVLSPLIIIINKCY